MRKFWAVTVSAALLSTSVGSPAGAQQAGSQQPRPDDWPRYTRDLQGTRFSPLDQINTRNVGQLKEAWTFRLRPEGGAGILGGTVPIVVDGIMYLPLGNAVVALDPTNGTELWRHRLTSGIARRSVSYWPGDGTLKPRIFYSTGDSLVALQAANGQVDTAFGTNGIMKIDGTPYQYPPSVFKNVLVIGASNAEMSRGPNGNTRAYDARTGRKLWEFNSVPQPGEVGHETWLDDGWRDRSGTNMWIWYITADPDTDTLYITIGSPSPNYYGGDRPGSNLFGNSIVALDANTGKHKWHFQTIHHDLWDWDLPAPPVLFDVTVNGRKIPALAETGKPGLMYILNRQTGEPIHGVEERPVAKADVPGEWYSPTQPFPVKPAQLNRGIWTPDDVVRAEDTTPEHVAACRKLLDSYGGTFFNQGSFTPFFLHNPGDPPKASINMPHNGGSVWGGSAADPRRGIVYVNTSESGSIGWIEKRTAEGDYGRGTAGSTQPYDRGSLAGPGAYSSFSAPQGGYDANNRPVGPSLPCIRPPWGRLLAVDANSGEILWASKLGLTESLPAGKQDTGTNNASGGATVTAGGLVFIGATGDGFFRAFDAANGSVLWQTKLTYPAMTLPISYRGKDGKQYIAVVAVGAGLGGPGPRGPDGRALNQESLIAWALPN